MTDATEETKTDGRHDRSARTRLALLRTCREMMRKGVYRPPMAVVCARSALSIRSGFAHFDKVERLWRAALEDPLTHTRVAQCAVGQEAADRMSLATLERMVNAIVFHVVAD